MTPMLRQALESIIKPEALDVWLATPNPAFRNRTPNQVVADGDERLLWRMFWQIASCVVN